MKQLIYTLILITSSIFLRLAIKSFIARYHAYRSSIYECKNLAFLTNLPINTKNIGPNAFIQLGKSPQIFIGGQLLTLLNHAEIKAIILHEKGHLAISKISAVACDDECMADDYSVMNTNGNPTHLINALQKIGHAQQNSSEELKYRIERLQKRLPKMIQARNKPKILLLPAPICKNHFTKENV